MVLKISPNSPYTCGPRIRAMKMVEIALSTRQDALPMSIQKTPVDNLRHRSDLVRYLAIIFCIGAEKNLDCKIGMIGIRMYRENIGG